MDVATALGELSAAGSEQTRKTYRRHGAPEPLFGVSFATLRAMAKRLGVDHALAIGLWDTGNTDARCLAALIADPAQLTEATADAWAAATRYHTVIDLVAGVVARSPIALERMESPAGKRQYRRGLLHREADGSLSVETVGGPGSHLIAALAASNCLIVIDEAVTEVVPGSRLTVIPQLLSQR